MRRPKSLLGLEVLGPKLRLGKWQRRRSNTKGGEVQFLAIETPDGVNERKDITIVRQKNPKKNFDRHKMTKITSPNKLYELQVNSHSNSDSTSWERMAIWRGEFWTSFNPI